MATIYIENYNQLANLWKKAPAIVEKELKRALTDSLSRVEGQAVKQAPVDTGNLRNKITTTLYDLSGRVHTSDGGQQVKYLKWVHEGRGEINARPGKILAAKAADLSPRARAKYASRINKKGYVVFGKRVKATKANPFFDRAHDKEERNVLREFDKALENVIDYLSNTQ